jgi:hypothetical protein
MAYPQPPCGRVRHTSSQRTLGEAWGRMGVWAYLEALSNMFCAAEPRTVNREPRTPPNAERETLFSEQALAEAVIEEGDGH